MTGLDLNYARLGTFRIACSRADARLLNESKMVQKKIIGSVPESPRTRKR